MVKYVRGKSNTCEVEMKSIGYFKRNECPKVNAAVETRKTRTKKMITGFLDSEIIKDLDEKNLVEERE